MAVANTQSEVSPVTLVVIILVLAGLDLVGAVVAKEWTLGRSSWFFVAGTLSFIVLFAVYAAGLRYAELLTVNTAGSSAAGRRIASSGCATR